MNFPWPDSAALLAYIDPGSSSMVFQMAIAGLLTGLYAAKSRLRDLGSRVLRLFGRGADRS